MGWLADFVRFWWGLLYWNTRKSVFRLRGGRSRCPCQNPSDSGRAGQTGCDAALDWRTPARFRRVCPLLVLTPEGLRCSVDTKDVRPFWGRAAGYVASAAAGIYLAGVLGAFALLRTIGFPLSPLALAWPPRWHEIRTARSDYFAAKGERALAGNRVNEAILSLELAYRDNPRNYDAGLRLAQMVSIGQPEVADRLYPALMREHPANRAVTAQAWLRSLLVHGELARVADLAGSQAVEDAAHRDAWLNVLFFAARHTGDDRALRELVAREAARLRPIDVALINSELLIREGRGSTLLSGLTTPLPREAGSYGPYFQVSRLLAIGLPAEALSMLERYADANRLEAADAYRLRLDVLGALGREEVLRARLDNGTVNARELQLVCAHLVRQPDAASLAALGRSLQRSTLPADVQSCAAYTAYYVACGVQGDWDQARIAAERLREASGTRMAGLDAVEAFFKQQEGRHPVQNILPILPTLPLDLIYALYDRYDRPVTGVTLHAAAAR